MGMGTRATDARLQSLELFDLLLGTADHTLRRRMLHLERAGKHNDRTRLHREVHALLLDFLCLASRCALQEKR